MSDANLRRDLIKLFCVIASISGIGALFFYTPALSTPTFLSILFAMLFSPLVTGLERRGYPRTLSIIIIFFTIGSGAVTTGFFALQSGVKEWESFREDAPKYFKTTVTKLGQYEAAQKKKYPFLQSVQPTQTLLSWGQDTGKWFVSHGASIMGDLLMCLFLVPIITFALLSEGVLMRRKFFQLIPNRMFESVYLITMGAASAISDYVRAKIFEALIVGLLAGAGFYLIGAPYAIVLGIVVGVTNIIPYIGPVIGAVPGLAIAALNGSPIHIFWNMFFIYLIVNIIDIAVIFPFVVAKLVNLHPLILIATVAVGQQYYGLIGMLISVPVATAIKVTLEEMYRIIYEKHGTRTSFQETPLPRVQDHG
ncbi:MAG: hypothetical protein A2583_01170 [Bdellovibrionales bacterium RIFOXYD1_FULL_53_11]|nr:MAG: hypothetical protein A2583_01170 [Bdellovibrionales bacterium RIFOXYD1_FULL_53_11]